MPSFQKCSAPSKCLLDGLHRQKEAIWRPRQPKKAVLLVEAFGVGVLRIYDNGERSNFFTEVHAALQRVNQ
jgi:hypothetical protein